MNDRLNAELAREYYKLAPVASITLCGLLAVTLYFFWGKVPGNMLLAWAGLSLFGTLAFMVAAWRFKRSDSQRQAAGWLRIYAYLVLMLDVPWGMIGPMSFMIDNQAYHMLTLFMLGGMTAGGILSRGLVFRIYVISLIALLTPITLTLALQRTPLAEGMLALVLVYVLFMLTVARNYSTSINRNILLWLDNEKLLGQLRRSHKEVKEANRVLTQEIEHRKRIEQDLVQAKERSEQANQAKNQFLANVSHELRTPLNGIIGFTEMLRHEALVPEHQSHVGQIGKAALTLKRIVNDILDISAIEAGHISFHEEPFSLRTELEEAVAMLRPMALSKQLGLQMRVGEEVADGLRGDANRLRQIIGNLLTNALKYTEVGHVSLVVSQLAASDKAVQLRFEVEDTGIGIAPDALQTIFDDFTRVENFETRKGEGVGLGLAIVKTLVQKMHGEVAVRSTPGSGSCFSVELAFTADTDSQRKAPRVEPLGMTPAQWRDFNVLVVDDNEINRKVLTTFLAKTGILYAEASDGYAALEHLRASRFDVVLLDIQLPGLSGIDVAKKLREEFVRTPLLIAVTAHAFPEQRQLILDAGFSGFLVKPIVMTDLVESLTQAYVQRYPEEHRLSRKQLLV